MIRKIRSVEKLAGEVVYRRRRVKDIIIILDRFVLSQEKKPSTLHTKLLGYVNRDVTKEFRCRLGRYKFNYKKRVSLQFTG